MNSIKKILLLIIVGIFVAGSHDVYAMNKKARELARLNAELEELQALAGQTSDDKEAEDDQDSDAQNSEGESEEETDVKPVKPVRKATSKTKASQASKAKGKKAAQKVADEAASSSCCSSKVIAGICLPISVLMLYLVGSGYYHDSGALPPGDFTGFWMFLSALGLGGAGAYALRS